LLLLLLPLSSMRCFCRYCHALLLSLSFVRCCCRCRPCGAAAATVIHELLLLLLPLSSVRCCCRCRLRAAAAAIDAIGVHRLFFALSVSV
jgi:hypothetical protein